MVIAWKKDLTSETEELENKERKHAISITQGLIILLTDQFLDIHNSKNYRKFEVITNIASKHAHLMI